MKVEAPRVPRLVIAKAFLGAWVVLSAVGAAAAQDAPSCPAGYRELARDSVNLILYCGTVTQYKHMREIEAEIRRYDDLIARDRRAIEGWQRELPDILKALDEWVGMDAEARRERNVRAINDLITVALAGVQMHAETNVREARGELQTLFQQYANSPLNSPEFHDLLQQQSRAAGIVHKWQSYQQMAETLERVRGAVQGMNELQREKYGRAIVEFASLAIQDPRLKILVAEVDFLGAAIPANSTAWTARHRVDELLALQEDRLKAVASDANSLKKHVDGRKGLIRERESILASVRPRR